MSHRDKSKKCRDKRKYVYYYEDSDSSSSDSSSEESCPIIKCERKKHCEKPKFKPAFLHAYSVTSQILAKEQAVSFDFNNALVGPIAHVPGSTDIFIWQPGFYRFYTNLYHIEPCQFSIIKNGLVVVPGSIIGSPSGSTQSSTELIYEFKECDFTVSTPLSPTCLAALIQVVNHTSFVDTVELNGSGGSGSATPQVTATFVVDFMGPPLRCDEKNTK